LGTWGKIGGKSKRRVAVLGTATEEMKKSSWGRGVGIRWLKQGYSPEDKEGRRGV